MNLTERTKEKINNYFNGVSAEQLYKLTLKYGIIEAGGEQVKNLAIHNVVEAKPEKVCELIRQKFDDWVFGLETQAGEKLKVVDSTDFNDIITEIESEVKDL